MIQGTVVTKDITGDDFEHTKDLNESVEDLVVEDMAQSFSKVREGTLARNSIITNSEHRCDKLFPCLYHALSGTESD